MFLIYQLSYLRLLIYVVISCLTWKHLLFLFKIKRKISDILNPYMTFFPVFYISVILITSDVIGKRRGQSFPPPDGPKLLSFSVEPPVNHAPRLVVPVDTKTDLRLGCQARNVDEPIQVSLIQIIQTSLLQTIEVSLFNPSRCVYFKPFEWVCFISYRWV